MTHVLLALMLSQSVHLDAGQDAPFAGQLIADAEHICREQVNERNAAFYDAAAAKKGSVSLPGPALIAIVAGAVAVGVALGVAGAVVAKR